MTNLVPQLRCQTRCGLHEESKCVEAMLHRGVLPEFGRTQYCFGAVVLTCESVSINLKPRAAEESVP